MSTQVINLKSISPASLDIFRNKRPTIHSKQNTAPDLVCFSHLRWNFVFQRPQHLLTRLSAMQKVYFVEEPIFSDSEYERLDFDRRSDNLCIIVPRLKHSSPDEVNDKVRNLLNVFLIPLLSKRYNFWYYTPMALEFSRHFNPATVIYDCMDELSHFAGASEILPQLEEELFKRADVVFTGGKSLYDAKKSRHQNIHCMPSSIEKEHFGTARNLPTDPLDQKNISGPRFGFYGVVDERFDIDLVRKIAEAKPDWNLIILGPVVKINPDTLPKFANVHYLGSKTYQELPNYLGNWDVAIMPFAINASTKFISPTKTPEYLSGGKPVVSTPITDVITPYEDEGLVYIGRTSEEFIKCCELALESKNDQSWLSKVDEFLSDMSWQNTAASMSSHIANVRPLMKYG